MSREFSINPDQVKSTSKKLVSSHVDLRKLANMVNACSDEAFISMNNADYISDTLKTLYRKTLDEAAKMDSLEQALSYIVATYEENETTILENIAANDRAGFSGGDNQAFNSDSRGTDKRNWWDRFWDWLFRKDVDEKYVYTSDEQEVAADRYMQQRVQELMQNEHYSEETWKNASVEERKKILEDYMHEVSKILDVDVKNKVVFTNTPPSNDGLINYGAYVHGSREVRINSYVIENYPSGTSYRLLTTITHELRHAYQNSAIDNPTRYQVSKETIDAWKHSFDTYAREQSKGYEAYRNILVERDARAFAGQD